jgi:hypothetical protein
MGGVYPVRSSGIPAPPPPKMNVHFDNNTPKWRLAEYIRERLLGSSDMRTLVGERIYPVFAPDVEGDFVILTRSSYKAKETKFSILEYTTSVIIEAYSDDYARSLDIAEAIDAQLAKIHEEEYGKGGVTITIQDSGETLHEGKFVQILEYAIK